VKINYVSRIKRAQPNSTRINVMNKKLIALALLAGSTFASVAHAADGKINFAGTVTSAACAITTEAASQTVNLEIVSTTSLANAKNTASPTRFNIVLTNCPTTAARVC
jgi:major type 1 subunit fimbrin (pilin)